MSGADLWSVASRPLSRRTLICKTISSIAYLRIYQLVCLSVWLAGMPVNLTARLSSASLPASQPTRPQSIQHSAIFGADRRATKRQRQRDVTTTTRPVETDTERAAAAATSQPKWQAGKPAGSATRPTPVWPRCRAHSSGPK